MKHLINCHNPQWVYNKYTHERILASCGHCPACLNGKHLRHVDLMEKQSKLSKYAFFCTLTYDDLNVPKLYFTKERDALYNDKGLFVDISQYNDEPTLSWLSKKKYVEYSDFKDFQDFMKRFRQNVRRLMPFPEAVKQFKTYGSYEPLSYYASSEFGPFTARPHFHCIIFFNSDWLATSFEQVFFKSWTLFDRTTHRRRSKGVRSSCRPCQGAEFAYTAAYCDGNTDLPSIFTDKTLRPRHSYSKKPLLGSVGYNLQQTAQLLYSGGLRRFDGLDKHGQPVVVRVPRALENRLFPKCPSFGSVDDSSRMLTYRLPFIVDSLSGGRIFCYNDFKEWLTVPENLRLIYDFFGPCTLSSSLSRQLETVKPFYGYWLASVRFHANLKQFNLKPERYLQMIKEYYSLKDYYRLKDYYEYLQEFSKVEDIGYAYSLCDIQSYVKLPTLPYQESFDFRSMVSETSRINEDGKKSKKDRDYQLRGNAVVFNP